MKPVFTRQERYKFALLRERDELTYQIGLYSGWIAQKQRRIAHIDEQISEMERKAGDEAEC